MSLFGGLIIIGALACVLLAAALVLRSGPGLVRFVQVVGWVTVAVVAASCAIGVGQSLIGDTTTVSVPLVAQLPGVRLPGLTIDAPASASILSGGADRATLTLTGLSWTSRSLLAASAIVQAAVAIVLTLLVMRLAANMRADKPFRGLARPLVVSGFVLFVGAGVWSLVGSIGAAMAGREALEIHGWTYAGGGADPSQFPTSIEDLAYLGWPEPAGMSVTFSFVPFLVACALALLGMAFRVGERMQADTEGLV